MIATALLAALWKMLIVLGGVFGRDFWSAVFGPAPIAELGPAGLALLALFVPGAIAFWFVTAVLFKINREWLRRLGLD